MVMAKAIVGMKMKLQCECKHPFSCQQTVWIKHGEYDFKNSFIDMEIAEMKTHYFRH